jgi:glycosyltransferase involved in cell wall biosynthesis
MKSISIVIPNYNDGKILTRCLSAVRDQNYDQKKIEIVVADGGSTDNSSQICKKFQAKIVKESTGSPEGAKAVGIKNAKNELILMIDADTILPNRHWLKKMVACLEKEKQAIAAYTWRYSYKKSDKILNRYFALFGANDPLAYFLRKTDRQDYIFDKYRLLGKVEDKGNYFRVEFGKDRIPTLGANGFLIWKKYYDKLNFDEKSFYHIDVNVDLIEKGLNKYVVVKNDIWHASGESFFGYFKRRYRYLSELYLKESQKRRYKLYDPKTDCWKLVWFCVTSLTLIYPIIISIKGYRKIKDLAWFLHPVMCLGIMGVYTIAVLKNILSKLWRD